jgi:hypothetical protein
VVEISQRDGFGANVTGMLPGLVKFSETLNLACSLPTRCPGEHFVVGVP